MCLSLELSGVIIKCILISGNIVILREIPVFASAFQKRDCRPIFFDSMMDGALATSTPFANNTNKMHMPAQMLCAQCRSSHVPFFQKEFQGIPSKYLQNTNMNIFATLERRDSRHLNNAFNTTYTANILPVKNTTFPCVFPMHFQCPFGT